MLTEHEEKLIQRYYIYPKIAITAVIMALALGVPFILLEMIDDLVFHDEEVIFWGLYVYLGFAALYLILFCYCTLRAKLGMRKEEWQELQRRLKVRQQQSDYSAAAAGAMAMGAAGRLMQKSQNKTVRGAGTAAQVAGAVGAVATAGAMSAEIAHNAQAMAEAYGVPLPRTKGLRTVLVLLPLVILIGTYIPQYSHAHTAMQQNKAHIYSTLLFLYQIPKILKPGRPLRKRPSRLLLYRILKLWQSKIKTLPATIMIRCVLFHTDFGNSLCYNKFNLRYRTASTNLEFD